MKKTLVMKFGGASVSTVEHFKPIAELIRLRTFEYPQIVVVVSAMGDTTDQLIDLAKKVHPDPPKREYDMLLTVGERISMALLAMALSHCNLEAYSFTGSQSGIITCPRHSDARIIEVRPHRILPHLHAGRIIIIAGFQGVSLKGEITTLGRGGSDTSAVALGVALKAEKVEFYKDVPGIFSEDPKINPKAQLLKQLNYDQALEIVSRGSQVLQPRCVLLAKQNGLPLHVLSYHPSSNDKTGTLIYSEKEKIPDNPLFEEASS
jgi:aspartate kinase